MDFEINQAAQPNLTTTGPKTLVPHGRRPVDHLRFRRQRRPGARPAQVGHHRRGQPVLLVQLLALLGQPRGPVGRRIRRRRRQRGDRERSDRQREPPGEHVRRGRDQPHGRRSVPGRHVHGVRQRVPQEPLVGLVPRARSRTSSPRSPWTSGTAARSSSTRSPRTATPRSTTRPPAGSRRRPSPCPTAGRRTYNDVFPGTYSVTEGAPPAEWTFVSLTCTATGSGDQRHPERDDRGDHHGRRRIGRLRLHQQDKGPTEHRDDALGRDDRSRRHRARLLRTDRSDVRRRRDGHLHGLHEQHLHGGRPETPARRR